MSGILRELRDQTRLYISDVELRSLETFARRIRCEIFFAKRWFIVEGQAKYLVVHAMARALDYDLDERGVAVIDAMNNGNPALFAALARALSIPWIAVFDGDQAGTSYCDGIRRRNFDATFVADRCRTHAAGTLEEQLIADSLELELRDILATLEHADAVTLTVPDLLGRLEDNKTAFAAELAARMTPALAQRMPQQFREAIAALRGLV